MTTRRPSRSHAASLAPVFWVLAAFLLFPIAADAQLTPDRTYFGVNRSIPMTVAVPDGAEGEVEIVLLAPQSAAEVAKAPAAEGRMDLAGLFPVLWTRENPQVLYAQLLVGGDRIGPAVVLQPMLTPRRAQNAGLRAGLEAAFDKGDRRHFLSLLDPQSNAALNVVGPIVFPAPKNPPTYAGLRAWTDRHVVFDTELGEIEIALRPDVAPHTAYNLIHLVEGGFYVDIPVHRIIPVGAGGDPFIIQFGDPTGAGAGGPGYEIDLEPSALPHDFGVISMARTPSDPDSARSQIFIALSREGTRILDGAYTSFGQVVRGAETLLNLEAVTLAPDRQTPVTPPIVRSARTTPAPPYGEGPAPVKRPEKRLIER